MLDGQKEAICPMSEVEILEKLNNEVLFLKDNPKHKDKGMIGIIVNCKGQVVQCKMSNMTKDEVLYQQIEEVFKKNYRKKQF